MARRRRDTDPVPDIAKLVALLAFALLFFPVFRQSVITFFFWLLAIAAVGVLAWVGYRLLFRRVPPAQPFQQTRVYDLSDLKPVDTDPSPSLKQTLNEVETLLRRTQAPRVSSTGPKSSSPFPYYQSTQNEAENPFQRTTTPDLETQIKKIDWFQFEKIVCLLYEKLGYAVTRRGGANPDGGIDLIIAKDGLRTAVQCKHWKAWRVGVRGIREFIGALTDAGLTRGIFITMKGYTREAKDLADKHNIEILEEFRLISMLRSSDMAYDPAAQEILRDEQKYCPKCERPMILRTATKGPNPGEQFWGCSAYPRCHCKLPFNQSQD